MRERYVTAGYSVREHQYDGGTNLIAEPRDINADEDVVIIGAHYDSVGNAGANDDGSGTIAVLAIAEALADCDLDYTPRFMAFDQEEKGLVGSKAYVGDLEASGELSSVKAVVIAEMLAYDSDDDGEMEVVDCGLAPNQRVTAIFEKVLAADPKLGIHNDPGACIRGSDHGPFWEREIIGVAVAQSSLNPGSDTDPCYHETCDTAERLNYPYFASIATATARMLVHPEFLGTWRAGAVER